MTTLNSTSILALIIAQNPYHIISIQGQMPMSHAQNTYDFEIAEDDPHYDDMVNYSGDNLRTHIFQSLENLEELLEQEDINLRTLRIKELEISFTVTRRTKSEYLKSLDFWYNPLTNYKEYQIPLQK